jgi:MOSC domain-containing protein
VPTVAGFNLTPVKSTALHRPDRIALGTDGAVGDRRFLCVRSDGTRLSGISKAALIPIVAQHDAAAHRLSLTFPDGGVAEGNDRPRGSVIRVQLFDREIPVREIDPALTAVLRAHVGDDTLTIARVIEPEYAGGAHRVSIVGRASVADVGSRMAGDGLDPRRFRMLIEVDGLDPYEEDSWGGHRVRIGDAIVRVGRRMPRCVMTTLDPDTGVQDAPVLHVLASYRTVEGKPILGMHGDVERGAEIAAGDAVELLRD